TAAIGRGPHSVEHWRTNEFSARTLLPQPMNNPRLGYHNKLRCRTRAAVRDRFFRGADSVRKLTHFARTFRGDNNFRIRVALLKLKEAVPAELNVHVTITSPKSHWPAGLFSHPFSEVLVRNE